MITSSHFFDLEVLIDWKSDYLVHIYKEACKYIARNKFPSAILKKLTSIANTYYKLKAIANLETMILNLNEYKYFLDFDIFIQNFKGSSNELHNLIIDHLDNDFDSEANYSLHFLSIAKANEKEWKNISKEFARQKLESAYTLQNELLPDRSINKIRKYKHRMRPPAQTGKLLNEESYYKLKSIEPNKQKQLRSAYDSLKEIYPFGFGIFEVLTDRIHLVRSKDLVSYSHFTEQGITYMNLWGRDFLDTMDDLIHENSHHHLNLIFKKYKMFDRQSDDEIYFSPWRNSLRPLYAILHSVFTFTWGAMLFENILKNQAKMNQLIPKKYHEKVQFRFIEETINLDYSLNDLQSAMQAGDFTSHGVKLIGELNSIHEIHMKSQKTLWKQMSINAKAILENRKRELKKIRKEFDPIL
jgi:hypothetical protein